MTIALYAFSAAAGLLLGAYVLSRVWHRARYDEWMAKIRQIRRGRHRS